ncbi:MAG: ATP-binding protein [Rikenellaceae bacterium]
MDTQILKEQIIKRMKFDNPWWVNGEIPSDYMTMKPRLYLEPFYPLVAERSINRGIILMGPRRVGKSVMLFHAIQRLINDGVDPQRIVYLSIDTPIYNNISLEELFGYAREALLKGDETSGFYVIYDEIQYLKDWEIHLKSLIDSFRNVRFVASGSAAAALKMKSQESGAGRFTDFMLPPLTFNEYINLLGYDNLIVPTSIEWAGDKVELFNTIDIDTLNRHFLDYINYGGYPELVLLKQIQNNPSQFVKNDIVDKVLLRDLPSLYGIQDIQELNRLFVHIVYRCGCEFSWDSLTKGANIKKETLKKYLQYLEAAFLIKVVNKVDSSARRFQRVTSFKIYLTNPSLRCALFSPLTASDEALGNMVETAIFAQWLQRDNTEVYYANWQLGRGKSGEVDMVGLDMVKQKPNWAVEIKWSDRYAENLGELSSLHHFMETNKLNEAIVTSIKQFGRKELDSVNLQFIPSAIYAYIVGHNTINRRIGNCNTIGL